MTKKRVLLSGLAAVALGLVLAACASRIPPRRNLPDWVHRIYLPIFKNKTSQPGLEELGTRLAVEEFLADGRLEIVSHREDADLIVDVVIVGYTENVTDFENDYFPYTQIMNVVAHVTLYDPADEKVPFARLADVRTSAQTVADYRRVTVTLDVDAREQLMRNLARGIVGQVITGFQTDGQKGPDKQPNYRTGEGVRNDMFGADTYIPYGR